MSGCNNFALGGNRTTGVPPETVINRPAGGTISFRENNAAADQMRIASGGNVGIGTTTPVAKLHVVGNIAATGNITTTASIIATGSIATEGRIVVGRGVSGNGGGLKHGRFNFNIPTAGYHTLLVVWQNPFPDANYTVNVVLEDLNFTAFPTVLLYEVRRKTAADVELFVETTGPKNINVNAIAIHD